ncbi:PREDICTED: transposon, partial [Prunus dulcis]
AFMKAYKPMVHPMASQDLWAKTNFPPLLPPEFHKQQGRPKKTKISSVGEPSPSSIPKAKHLPRYNLEIKCSICKEPGHNKRKCPRVNEAGSNSQ